ncbi:MAG: cyclic nucleotide-binding domain-containing protein [Verrucomicrobiota bacterium]|nr:cyclic nucleotide-binding domain-containing protein [Verrucomicrobiota bacterium]
MTAAEQHRILTQAKLKLVDTLVEVNHSKELVVIKNVPRCAYLTVDRRQSRILHRFRSSSTIPEMVPALIRDRQAVPLREFYELILKAVDAKILIEQVDPEPAIRAVEWGFRLRERVASFIGGCFMLFGLITLVLFEVIQVHGGIKIPGIGGMLLGIVPICLAFSLGYALAASVLSAHECEVYQPRLHWKTLFPHFKFNLDDAQMSSNKCRITVALVRLAPIFLLAGICVVQFESMVYMAVLGIFYFSKPISSPMVDMLKAVFGKTKLSTEKDFIFWLNRKPTHLIKAKLANADKRYQLIHAAYVIIWLAMLVLIHVQILDSNIVEFWNHVIHSTMLVYGIKGAAVALGAFLIVIVILNLIILFRYGQRKLTESSLWQRMLTKVPSVAEINRAHVMDMLNHSLLFKEIKPALREQVAERLLIAESTPGQYLIKKGDPGDYFYLVFAGKVEVCKPLLSGRLERVSVLGTGDCFGESALLRNSTRSHTVRAITKTIILALSKEHFQQYLLASLGPQGIIDILQKRAFLKRLPLCTTWSQANIELFCEKAVLEDYDKDEKVLARGQENQFFHIIHESKFRVAQQSKTLAILKMGDFFGEISLLQGSVTTADVISVEGGRLLSLHRSEFLKILGWDYQLALQFEAIASKRMGKPVFPLSEGNFGSL